ncbi:MAG: hypothetical protein A2Y82_01395 [Candidatus Buchananbacteria bacterium RBG_13_36_9]|uniref:Uncharacterized protein n=1 Tax=Candidatus Buchananbacteria bacterium RBG_13_36_9 TaxID=1797530 RepID=A0A1G1XQH7_9BACT|nr:MAG: hypothetical protein A2Y82_01395 [Candidatus Buchananbacteria bacterium RBG_13_36_9]
MHTALQECSAGKKQKAADVIQSKAWNPGLLITLGMTKECGFLLKTSNNPLIFLWKNHIFSLPKIV